MYCLKPEGAPSGDYYASMYAQFTSWYIFNCHVIKLSPGRGAHKFEWTEADRVRVGATDPSMRQASIDHRLVPIMRNGHEYQRQGISRVALCSYSHRASFIRDLDVTERLATDATRLKTCDPTQDSKTACP